MDKNTKPYRYYINALERFAPETSPESLWPYELLTTTESKKNNTLSNILVECAHASRHIPNIWNNLGLPNGFKQSRHELSDYGAKELSLYLNQKYDYTALLGTLSRACVELNRNRELLVTPSWEWGDIPGNQNISAEDHTLRETLYDLFHDQLKIQLKQIKNEATAKNLRPAMLSIHSYTQRFKGKKEKRDNAITVLYRENSTDFAKHLIQTFEHYAKKTNKQYNHPLFNIGQNIPYTMREGELEKLKFTCDGAAKEWNIPTAYIEMNQSWIRGPEGLDRRRIEWIGNILNEALERWNTPNSSKQYDPGPYPIQ